MVDTIGREKNARKKGNLAKIGAKEKRYNTLGRGRSGPTTLMRLSIQISADDYGRSAVTSKSLPNFPGLPPSPVRP